MPGKVALHLEDCLVGIALSGMALITADAKRKPGFLCCRLGGCRHGRLFDGSQDVMPCLVSSSLKKEKIRIVACYTVKKSAATCRYAC